MDAKCGEEAQLLVKGLDKMFKRLDSYGLFLDKLKQKGQEAGVGIR